MEGFRRSNQRASAFDQKVWGDQLSTRSQLNFIRKTQYGDSTFKDASGRRRSWHSMATGIVKHKRFEAVLSSAIMANAVVICFEVQYTGLQIGRDLQYRGYH